MNKENQNWKCPNCDTLNTGRRCVICGSEMPVLKQELKNTMHKTEEVASAVKTMAVEEVNHSDETNSSKESVSSNKGIIIALCSIIGVLVVAIIIVCIVLLSNPSDEITATENNSHTVSEEKVKEKETEEEPEEETPQEAEDEFITDAVEGIQLKVSVHADEMKKSPDYKTEGDSDMSYAVPTNFERVGKGHQYIAKDQTAYIRYWIDNISEDTFTDDIIKKVKSEFGGSVSLERADDSGYAFSTLRNDTVYYVKGVVNGNEMLTFMFMYPEVYKSVYDGYITDLIDGLRAENNGEVNLSE